MKRIVVLIVAIMLTCNTAFAEFTPQVDTNDGEKMYKFFDTLLRVTERNYRFGVTRQQLLEAAINEALKENPGLFDTLAKGAYSILDENSRYLSYEEYLGAAEKISGEFEGIGINVSEYNGKTIVGAPIKGTPAYYAGIMAGDIIVKVDDVDITGFVLDQTVKLIRGEVGTYVKLEVNRNGKLLVFDVARDVIKINPVSYEKIEGQNAAYINISSFNAYTSAFLEEALQELADKGIEKVVLDLRYNLGGLLAEAINVASFFVPNDTLIVIEDFKDEEKNTEYRSVPTDIKFDAVVLVNEYSASASEIVAAAISENKAGVLVGTTTFGKGTVQQNIQLKNGGAMWLTVAKYLTPLGNYIHELGI
ncbi:MAG: S41 family peptidase, partial [Clostridiaceae bacterium]|nr:S41 family peptidase [Clostridiaceae bacterium]